MTTDVDRASRFYSELFGWTPEVVSRPGSTYTTFRHVDTPVASVIQVTPQMGTLRPHGTTYFTVKNANETARKAATLGSTLSAPVQDVAKFGRFCGITSPQGVTFCVVEYPH